MDVVSNGCRFNVRTEGSSAAPWLMLSHSVATDLTMWDWVSDGLAEDFQLLRYDTRGHGGSDAPAGDYTMDMLADDAAGILDALKIDKVHFLGLSLGGMTGLGLALNHAARLHSLIVADARAQANPGYSESWQQRAASVAERGIEAIVEANLERWFTERFRRNDPDTMNQVRAMIRRTSPVGYRGCAAALAGLNYGDRLKDIRLPVLYLTGSDDQGAPPEVMKDMQQATPGSRYIEIADAGHIASIEQPAAFGTAVTDFLTALPAR